MKNVAIIGTGNIGGNIAKLLSDKNVNVVVASTSPDKDKVLADSLAKNVSASDIKTAIEGADIVLFAVWFDVIKQLIPQYKEALEGKIVIDPSNPIGFDADGKMSKIISADQSSGEILGALVSDKTKFVKAFGTISANSYAPGANANPKNVLFYASDDTSVEPDINELIDEAGFAPKYLGGLNRSIDIEVSGKLHEMGGLGKLVTLDDLKNIDLS